LFSDLHGTSNYDYQIKILQLKFNREPEIEQVISIIPLDDIFSESILIGVFLIHEISIMNKNELRRAV